MLLYPEIQRKAQAEVDRVIGRGRLPDFSDEPSLPYVTELVKEVLRSVSFQILIFLAFGSPLTFQVAPGDASRSVWATEAVSLDSDWYLQLSLIV